MYALQYNKSKAVSFHYIQNIEGKFVELLEFPKTTFQIITKLDFRNLTICQLFFYLLKREKEFYIAYLMKRDSVEDRFNESAVI